MAISVEMPWASEAVSLDGSNDEATTQLYEALRDRIGLPGSTAPPSGTVAEEETSTLTLSDAVEDYFFDTTQGRDFDVGSGLLEIFVAKRRFQEAFTARGARARKLFGELVDSAEPMALLDAALSEFALRGNQDRLSLAASALDEMGARAVPALRRISSADFRGQEAFVDLIVSTNALSSSERGRCLLALAKSPQYETRFRLLEQLDSLEPRLAWRLAGILQRDQDCEIREEVADWLGRNATSSGTQDVAVAG